MMILLCRSLVIDCKHDLYDIVGIQSYEAYIDHNLIILKISICILSIKDQGMSML